MRTITLFFLSTVMISGVGCTSFRTTILQQCSSGTFIFNTPKKKTKGLPVKLKVPTHVEVVVTEDFFILKKTEPENSATIKSFEEICIESGSGKKIRALNVTTEVIYTDKVFTVDFKRPAGGELSLMGSGNKRGITFDAQQYFKTIDATYKEQTLADINTALGTLKPSFAQKSSVTLPTNGQNNLQFGTREVARARFDITDPCWEQNLNDFVSKHVTACIKDCHNYQY